MLAPRRLAFDTLEDRTCPAGILNGNFDISDPAAAGFTWVTTGSAVVVNNQGVLNENPTAPTSFSQTTTILPDTRLLRFTIVRNNLLPNATSSQPDAFSVSLLDNASNPLVGPVVGVGVNDDFFRILQNGQVFFANGVTVPGAPVSGQIVNLEFPLVVTVDLAAIPTGTQARLVFDLAGFSPSNSSVVIDDVDMFQGPQQPFLAFQLAAASDSGVRGDDITNINPVTLIGTTDPLGEVRLDTDGDGFDDGITDADNTGRFIFITTLQPGPNVIRMRDGDDLVMVQRTVLFDPLTPTGTLIQPTPSSTVTANPGSVDIQWTDTGGSNLDPATFGIGDITITGVDIDRFQNLGAGLVRYFYSDDNDVLPTGTVTVTRLAGQVADFAANVNGLGNDTFTFNPPPPIGDDPTPPTLPPPAGGDPIPSPPLPVSTDPIPLTLEGGENLIVPGLPGQPTMLRFRWIIRDAAFNNELAAFVVDSSNGAIGGTLPGNPGYAIAALASPLRQTVFRSGEGQGTVRDLSFPAGARVGLVMIQDRSANAAIADGNTATIFFMAARANADGFSHAAGVGQGSQILYSWEDLQGGGDKDYNDMILTVGQAPQAPQATAGPAVVAPPGLTRVVSTLVSSETVFVNEVGLFTVDDAVGRIGTLNPGDAGYAGAALARRAVLFPRGSLVATNAFATIPAGALIGLYLAQNTSADEVLARNPTNGLQGPHAFFSFPAANADGFDHVRRVGADQFNFEDLDGGGDLDFNDLVFNLGFLPVV